MSLIDSERQWFKSKVGLQISETSRNVAFCAHTILTPDLLIVPNAADDERFANNPLVTGDPWIRFYAGAPLITPTGESLGSLCVVDKVQRTLTDTQTSSLRALSRQLMSQLELRRLRYLQEKNQRVLKDYQRTLEETNQKLMTQSLTDDLTG
jgi:GAF domain-containing protein